MTSLIFSNLREFRQSLIQHNAAVLTNLLASRKMTLCPAARVMMSPSLLSSNPPMGSDVVKLLISAPLAEDIIIVHQSE